MVEIWRSLLRLCIVEIKGRSGYPIFCATPVEQGMEVLTHTPEVCEIRKNIFDLILVEEMGVTKLKFEPIPRQGKMDNSSFAAKFDSSRCINYGRCVRVCLVTAMTHLSESQLARDCFSESATA